MVMSRLVDCRVTVRGTQFDLNNIGVVIVSLSSKVLILSGLSGYHRIEQLFRKSTRIRSEEITCADTTYERAIKSGGGAMHYWQIAALLRATEDESGAGTSNSGIIYCETKKCRRTR